MSNGGRYGVGLSKPQATEAVLAAIQTELKNQSNQITIISKKLDKVSTTVTTMNTQMEHLVTKESCAEGRKSLSDDLKKRMDGDREITGTDIKVPALWQNAVAAQLASESSKPDPSPPPESPPPHSAQQRPRGFAFWLGVIAAFVTISGGVVGVTFAAYKVLDVIDTTSTVLQQMERLQSQQPPQSR